jgi:cytochrome c-type biogenesis protein CcmH/NrfF
MPNRPHLRSKVLAAALLAAALLHGTVPLTNERVRRLGDQLQCKCGCNASITGCNMMNCHFADPVRMKLLAMVDEGRSDDQIYAELVRIYGKEIMLKPPAEGFYLLSWIMPFAALAGGLGLVYLVLQRYMRRRGAAVGPEVAEVESPDLERYKSKIDKEMSDLE